MWKYLGDVDVEHLLGEGEFEKRCHVQQFPVGLFQTCHYIDIQDWKYHEEWDEHRQMFGAHPEQGQYDKGGDRNGFDHLHREPQKDFHSLSAVGQNSENYPADSAEKKTFSNVDK